MTVNWSEGAVQNLQAIHDHIALNSARYAQVLLDRIMRRVELLFQFPRLGGMVPEYKDDSIRELLESPYRIIYRVSTDRVDILAVIHGA